MSEYKVGAIVRHNIYPDVTFKIERLREQKNRSTCGPIWEGHYLSPPEKVGKLTWCWEGGITVIQPVVEPMFEGDSGWRA
jgi:hypothetical protein